MKVDSTTSVMMSSGHHIGIHNLAKSGNPFNMKHSDMTPEITLVEFISTSAAYHGVTRQNIQQLEWDLLRVFNNNIMPANAAAWYMAKRRFYMNNSADNQLLPFLLKNYPKKFAVRGNMVEFLETYDKEIARKKMQQLNRQGLFAYFDHKVEEYGVYFFDPKYYESTEPFHANLRLVTNIHQGHKNRLISTYFGNKKSSYNYFGNNKKNFVYQQHNNDLVTISRQNVEVSSNTTGIIISMIDNRYGIIQFPWKSDTEKALFSTKHLFKNGWQYKGDPMKFQALQFDGYRVPNTNKKSNQEYTWFAVLVWSGTKPNPKYCATKEDLMSSPYFQGNNYHHQRSNNYDNLLSKAVKGLSINQTSKSNDSACIVGEVLSIRKNGAEVSFGKDTKEKAFIHGWIHSNTNQPGKSLLTTTQGVELCLKDLITYSIDPDQTYKGFKAVGCNVTVLKHSEDKSRKGSSSVFDPFSPMNQNEIPTFTAVQDSGKSKTKKTRKTSKSSNASGNRRRTRSKSANISSTSSEGDEMDTNKPRTKKEKRGYAHFIMESPFQEEEKYDSDMDPSFHHPDVDFDEYSDGEIPDEEVELLMKEIDMDLDTLKEELQKWEEEKKKAKEASENKDASDDDVEKQKESSSKSGEEDSAVVVDVAVEATENTTSSNNKTEASNEKAVVEFKEAKVIVEVTDAETALEATEDKN